MRNFPHVELYLCNPPSDLLLPSTLALKIRHDDGVGALFATGPPIRGDPFSQSQAYIPLKPLPPLLSTLSPKQEDAQALKGSKSAGWDVKIKTCKFLSCPPAWATPPSLPPTLGFHTFLDWNRSGMLQTLNFFVLCLCY